MTESIIGGKVFIAPNGKDKVRIFRHGYVEFLGNISEDHKALISEMSEVAVTMTGKKRPNPSEVFKLMGWVEENPSPTPVTQGEKE